MLHKKKYSNSIYSTVFYPELTVGKDSVMGGVSSRGEPEGDPVIEAESERLMCSYGEGGVALDDDDDNDGEEEDDSSGGEDFLLTDRSTGSSCVCVGASGPRGGVCVWGGL